MAEGTGGLELNYSPGLEAWLDTQRVSLAFAIPPAKLFFIGLRADSRLSAFERTFNKCMGLAVGGSDTIYVGTRSEIWRLEHGPRPATDEEDFDRCFVPRRVWTTGYINCHDVAVAADGQAHFVNTRSGAWPR